MSEKTLQLAAVLSTVLAWQSKLKKTVRSKVAPDFKLQNEKKLWLYTNTSRRSSNFRLEKLRFEKNGKERMESGFSEKCAVAHTFETRLYNLINKVL